MNEMWSEGIGGEIKSVSISPEGSYIAVGTASVGGLHLYSRDGEHLWTHPTGCSVFGSAVSSDGEYIVMGSEYVRVFNLEGEIEWQWDSGYFAYSVAITPDGAYIAVGSDDKSVTLLEYGEGKIWRYELPDDPTCVDLSADGQYVVAGTDGQVYLLDGDGELVWEIDVGKGVQSVAIAPDGTSIAAGTLDYRSHLISKEGEILWRYMTNNRVFGVALSENGDVVTGSHDDHLYIINGDGDRILETETSGHINDVDVSSDGSVVVAGTGNGDQHLILYERATQEMTEPEPTEPEPTAVIETIENIGENVSEELTASTMPAAAVKEESYLSLKFTGLTDTASPLYALAAGIVVIASAAYLGHRRRR
ncbi:WD40 repeat domain-containing protein [Methanofollis fontis]|nr:PQQ-binding-like beta-propeller repeat protein [Methanofollis fontis]